MHPIWQADNAVNKCNLCSEVFSLVKRRVSKSTRLRILTFLASLQKLRVSNRSHCCYLPIRLIFCGSCCNYRAELPELNYKRPQRICKRCKPYIAPNLSTTFTFQVVALGSDAVGKSQLLNRYVKGSYIDNFPATIG